MKKPISKSLRPKTSEPPEGLVRVGQIAAAFGIKGQAKIRPLTDFAERFDVGRRLRAADRWLTVENVLLHGQQLILKFEEIPDRTGIEELQGVYLEAVDAERPELDEDEYLTRDLIGMRVITDTGRELGLLTDVLAKPAHDLLVVGSLMIPAVHEFVLKVDLTRREITVRLIDGMEP